MGSNPLSGIDNFGLDAATMLPENSKLLNSARNVIDSAKKDPNRLTFISEGGLINGNPVLYSKDAILSPKQFKKYIVNSEYWKNRVKNNKSVIIELYSCNSGRLVNGTSFATQISNLLKDEVRSTGVQSDVYIVAPNGYIVSVSGGLDNPVPQKFAISTFSYPRGEWNIFKNGVVIQKTLGYDDLNATFYKKVNK